MEKSTNKTGRRISIIFELISLALLITVLVLYLQKPKVEIVRDNTLQQKVDSLNIEIDKLKVERDSLLTSIDSSEAKVIVIEKWYEKEYNTIVNQPTDSNCLFFSNYLSKEFK